MPSRSGLRERARSRRLFTDSRRPRRRMISRAKGREPQLIADDTLDTHTKSRATYGPHGSIQPVAAYAATFILGYRTRGHRRGIRRSGTRWRDDRADSPRDRLLRAGAH